MSVTYTDVRADFETWAVHWGHPIERAGLNGGYVNTTTAACWHAYRAALGIVK